MVSKAELKELYPRADVALLEDMGKTITALFDEFEISKTPVRTEFFLAQVGHESGGGTVGAENMNYSAPRLTVVWPSRFPTLAAATPFAHQPEKLANQIYANRMGNGPPQSGDGFKYRGRGLIQITGKDGYKNVGARAGIDLVAAPEHALVPKNALRVACAFWKWKDLNAVCDTGDFVAVTRRINGGTVGMPDRRAWLDKVRRVLSKPPAATQQPDPDLVRRVQLALRQRGFDQVGAADGLLGPRTLAALSEFRRLNGLAPGGWGNDVVGILLAE
jgi:putative chitinase